MAVRDTGKATHLKFPRPKDRAPPVLAELRTLVTPPRPPRRCHSTSRDTKLPSRSFCYCRCSALFSRRSVGWCLRARQPKGYG